MPPWGIWAGGAFIQSPCTLEILWGALAAGAMPVGAPGAVFCALRDAVATLQTPETH